MEEMVNERIFLKVLSYAKDLFSFLTNVRIANFEPGSSGRVHRKQVVDCSRTVASRMYLPLHKPMKRHTCAAIGRVRHIAFELHVTAQNLVRRSDFTAE